MLGSDLRHSRPRGPNSNIKRALSAKGEHSHDISPGIDAQPRTPAPDHPPHGLRNLDRLFRMATPVDVGPGIAVILSGLDDDGAAALKAFKQHGGITIVQNIQTAERPDMPHSAIRTGVVDHQVPPEAIAPLLENIAARYRKGKGAGA